RRVLFRSLNNNFVHDANEPFTETGAYGRFQLTAEQLADIEQPENYPLMVHAIRGVTVDEDLIVHGDEETGRITASFFLTAPPGVKTVTPLTTLVKLELDALQQNPAIA